MAVKKIKHKKVLKVYKAYFVGDGREICFLEKPNLKDLLKAFAIDNSEGEVTGAAFTVAMLNVYTKKKIILVKQVLDYGN